MRIEIFTGPGCGHCVRAKAMLDENGLDYTERDIADPAVREEFTTRLPRENTIPQVIVDGRHIGGSEDLLLWLESRADGM